MICQNDDLGTCPDCICGYNPIVVMATHQRINITTKNIELLRKQSVVPKIIIVCSLKEELDYYKKLDVSVLLEPNQPLGRKWQCGVNVAVSMKANPLIILGSDDILHPDYIRDGLRILNKGFDFFGCTSWYNYDPQTEKVFKCEYQGVNVDFPIGSGKMYSLKLLTNIKGKVFDVNVSRHLDDQGHRRTLGHAVYLERRPKILAVKGKWPVMNDTRNYLHSPNIKSEVVDYSIVNQFNYGR